MSISGIYLDKEYNLRFLSDSESSIRQSDLATALNVYYDSSIPDNQKSIMFSLDPEDSMGSLQNKHFWPDIALKKQIIGSTKFGDILFRADFLMKQISLGIQKNDIDFKYPAKLGIQPIHKLGQSMNNQSRLWFELDQIQYDEVLNNKNSSISIDNIKVKLKLKACSINNDFQEIKEQSGANRFAELFTQNYNTICSHYPIFTQLLNIYKAVFLAQWIYKQNIQLDIKYIQEIVQKHTLTDYVFQIPALKKTWQTQIIKEKYTHTHTRSVMGGINVIIDMNDKDKVKVNKLNISKEHFIQYKRQKNLYQIKERCSQCQINLRQLEIQSAHDSNPIVYVCTNHSKRQCNTCKQLIYQQEWVSIGDIVIHSKCFNCLECKQIIEYNFCRINDGFIHSKCKKS